MEKRKRTVGDIYRKYIDLVGFVPFGFFVLMLNNGELIGVER